MKTVFYRFLRIRERRRNPLIQCDYHVHSYLSFDAFDDLPTIARAAQEKGSTRSA